MKYAVFALLLMTGCAAKKPQQAHIVAPLDCIKHVQFTKPCTPDGKDGMWCDKVHAQVVCVKVVK